jgi:molybdenum cofactor cytidylyltransferase
VRRGYGTLHSGGVKNILAGKRVLQLPQVWKDLILGLEQPRLVTLIGGGGKTSLMYYLAGLLTAGGHAVIATTTTKLASHEQPGFRFAAAQSLEQAEAQVAKALRQHEAVTLVSGQDAGNAAKMAGVPPAWLEALARQFSDTIFIVEGDGAAGRPLKGHQAHEPVIPEASRVVVAVIGVDVLDKPLSAEWVHRPERVSELTGLPLNSPVTEEAVVRLLQHPEGYLRNCPEPSLVVPFINKVETPEDEAWAETLTEAVLAVGHPKIGGIISGSVQRGIFRLTRPNQR